MRHNVVLRARLRREVTVYEHVGIAPAGHGRHIARGDAPQLRGEAALYLGVRLAQRVDGEVYRVVLVADELVLLLHAAQAAGEDERVAHRGEPSVYPGDLLAQAFGLAARRGQFTSEPRGLGVTGSKVELAQCRLFKTALHIAGVFVSAARVQLLLLRVPCALPELFVALQRRLYLAG